VASDPLDRVDTLQRVEFVMQHGRVVVGHRDGHGR
jgi:hypothetical protein